MHYYQFNIGDYTIHTAHLDPIEDIAYRRMLDWCYTHERPLPQAVDDIARLIRMRDHAAAIRAVINEFFEQVECGWFSPRVQREIDAFRAKVEQASKAGKASAARRSNGRSTENEQPFNVRSTDVEPTINQEPLTKNQEPISTLDQTVVGEKKPKTTAPATRLPADWKPDESEIQFCKTTRPELDWRQVVEQFRDYWIAQPGVKGRKASWPATWRNWVRNQRQTQTTTNGKTRHELHADFVAKITGRDRRPVDDPTVIHGTAERLD